MEEELVAEAEEEVGKLPVGGCCCCCCCSSPEEPTAKERGLGCSDEPGGKSVGPTEVAPKSRPSASPLPCWPSGGSRMLMFSWWGPSLATVPVTESPTLLCSSWHVSDMVLWTSCRQSVAPLLCVASSELASAGTGTHGSALCPSSLVSGGHGRWISPAVWLLWLSQAGPADMVVAVELWGCTG